LSLAHQAADGDRAVAMEVHVFFRGKVPAKAALARALRELGFPFTIPDAKGSLAAQRGFMPMRLRREETGVEFDLYDRSAVAEFAARGVDQSYERMASFRWGGDMREGAAGLCGAAAPRPMQACPGACPRSLNF
jgi:hypothetical protein